AMTACLEELDELASDCGGLHALNIARQTAQLKGGIGLKRCGPVLPQPPSPQHQRTRAASKTRPTVFSGRPPEALPTVLRASPRALARHRPDRCLPPPGMSEPLLPRRADPPLAIEDRAPSEPGPGHVAPLPRQNRSQTGHRSAVPPLRAARGLHPLDRVDAVSAAIAAADRGMRGRGVPRHAMPRDARPRCRPAL